MAKKEIKISRLDNTECMQVVTLIGPDWGYHIDDESKPWYTLTHIPTGKRFGFFKRVSTMRELLKEDCFFNDRMQYGIPPKSWAEVRTTYYRREAEEAAAKRYAKRKQ